MLNETKKKIRKEVLARRNDIPLPEREAMSRKVCDGFVGLPVMSDVSSVMIFLSFGSEINTDYMIEWLWRENKKVLVPLCKPETREMDIFPMTRFDDVAPGYYGIREPKAGLGPPVDKALIDMVVVPAVAFDRRGYRVGYGGGYYDRFLTGMRVRRIGVAFSCQIVTEVPVGIYDQPVQGIVTEKEYIDTTASR